MCKKSKEQKRISGISTCKSLFNSESPFRLERICCGVWFFTQTWKKILRGVSKYIKKDFQKSDCHFEWHLIWISNLSSYLTLEANLLDIGHTVMPKKLCHLRGSFKIAHWVKNFHKYPSMFLNISIQRNFGWKSHFIKRSKKMTVFLKIAVKNRIFL